MSAPFVVVGLVQLCLVASALVAEPGEPGLLRFSISVGLVGAAVGVVLCALGLEIAVELERSRRRRREVAFGEEWMRSR